MMIQCTIAGLTQIFHILLHLFKPISVKLEYQQSLIDFDVAKKIQLSVTAFIL